MGQPKLCDIGLVQLAVVGPRNQLHFVPTIELGFADASSTILSKNLSLDGNHVPVFVSLQLRDLDVKAF
jgi:hypothetical protein